MKDVIKKSKEIKENIDNIFEGIFSVGTDRSREYRSRGEKKQEPLWSKDISPNPEAQIDYIQNIDGAYSSELPENASYTSFLNNGSYYANLIVLERENIRFVGQWNGGLFTNATLKTTPSYQESSFNGGTFDNATFDCKFDSWNASPESFLGGKITKTQEGLLGMKYENEGDYNSLYIFLIPIGGYLFISSSSGSKAYKMIKNIDSTGDDIILEDVSDGKKILLPWKRLNPGGRGTYIQISVGSSFVPLGIKNKINKISITKTKPQLGPKSGFKSIHLLSDPFLKDYEIRVNLVDRLYIDIYNRFLEEIKKRNFNDILNNIKAAINLDLLNDKNEWDDRLKNAIEIIRLFYKLKKMSTTPKLFDDIEKKVKQKFGFELSSIAKL